MRKSILFIVNPISGGFDKQSFPKLVDKYLDHEIFQAQIIYTQYIGHATRIALEGLDKGFDVIVAVGGDGTINEIASVLESSGKLMGIIPSGSGNGLARTLKIPLDTVKAISLINHLHIKRIDTGIINGKKFFNMAGIGFDAHISSLFANHKTRGFSGYVKTTFKEISNYKPATYQITSGDKKMTVDAFMVNIANSSQFGNNAHVSPNALVDDGLIDLCIIKSFPLYKFPQMAYHMFANTANKSKYVTIYQNSNFTIERQQAAPIHLDGEPHVMSEKLDISLKHLSLKIIINK